jgi:tripartite-type tricarboxylate transporter receptor subunit TctC
MGQTLGQTFVIDNKPGADGAIASADVIRAAPDGYTVYFGTNSPLAAVPAMRKTPPYDVTTDFTPIGNIGRFTHFLVVHPGVPANTMAELVAHAKANPGKLNYATGNTTSIVSIAQLFKLTGMNMLHVPFKGDPAALIDVMAGRVQFMQATQGQSIAFIREGKLRALAATGARRSALAPEVATLGELGFKFPLLSWMALVGPAKMRPEVVERLNRELNAALQIPKVQEDIARQAFEVAPSTPEELRSFLAQQQDIWGRTVKELGLQTD